MDEISSLNQIPVVAAFLQRREAEPVTLYHAKCHSLNYRFDKRDGTVSVYDAFTLSPREEYLPSKAEQAAITKEWRTLKFQKVAVVENGAALPELRLTTLRDPDKGRIHVLQIMNGEKPCASLIYSDGEWRPFGVETRWPEVMWYDDWLGPPRTKVISRRKRERAASGRHAKRIGAPSKKKSGKAASPSDGAH